VNHKDEEGVAALYGNDAMVVLPNRPPLAGREGIREWLHRLMQNREIAFRHENLRTETSSDGRLGHTVSRYEVTIIRPDGSKHEETGHWVQVWKRVNQRWRLAVEIACVDSPRQGQ
jgi:ketosteroid isomerase-like protein